MNLRIEVYSDVVCPWCYLGKCRLSKALSQLDGVIADIEWHAFELYPAMPKEGMERRIFAERKFGSFEAFRRAEEHLTMLGKEVGLEYRFENILRIPNTFDAHRLIWFARQHTLQNQLAEALFRAYFTDGKNVGDRSALMEIAASVGLPGQEVQRILEGTEGAEEVRRSERRASEAGIHGVPFFIFNDRYAVSGAQKPEIFLLAVRRALQEGESSPVVPLPPR